MEHNCVKSFVFCFSGQLCRVSDMCKFCTVGPMSLCNNENLIIKCREFDDLGIPGAETAENYRASCYKGVLVTFE